MTAISLVSTLLPPQNAPIPMPTAVSSAKPTTIIPPASASLFNAGGNSTTGKDTGSDGRPSGDPALREKRSNTASPNASAKSVVQAKARQSADQTLRTTQPNSYVGKTVTGADPDTTHRPLPKAEGPLPLPTADILLRL